MSIRGEQQRLAQRRTMSVVSLTQTMILIVRRRDKSVSVHTS
jgi:hypothetical protein